jgi:predicted metalloprotease with PDZ domain
MVYHLNALMKGPAIAGRVWLLVLIAAGSVQGQMLRGPDVGVWFNTQRGTSGTNELIVAQLADDGVFALAGLREGDRLVSINGRPIGSEAKFVEILTLLGTGNQVVNFVVIRDRQPQTLALNGSAVMRGVATPDPLYQAGLIIDERNRTLLIVQRVFPCTPAFYAGLRQADVITSINGQPISSLAELTKPLRLGGNLSLLVTRNEQTRQMTMSVAPERAMRSAARSASSEEAMLRWTTTPNVLRPGVVPRPPPTVPPYERLTSPPLLAPPIVPSMPPVVPSPPPVIPTLPPPGAVQNVPPA